LLAGVLRLGALAVALAAPLAVAASAQTFALANGLTVLVLPDHRAPTAVHMVWIRAGAMDEVDVSRAWPMCWST
jgi:zinc protease